MLHKCIHTHIYEEFTIQSHIQAYKGDANIYGPLWTLTCMCAMWTFLLIILYVFPFLFLPKKTLSSPTSSTIIWQTFPITTASYMTSPPYILLFAPHSPVICKGFFFLIYMYKSSRYYAVLHINLGPIFPWLTTLYALKLAPLQPSSTLAYIASNFLDYLPSPLIAIHFHFIFTQD